MRLKYTKRTMIAIALMVCDLFAVVGSYGIALAARYDFKIHVIPTYQEEIYIQTILMYGVIVVVLFSIFELYHSIWRFVSYAEIARVFILSILTGTLYFLFVTIFLGKMPAGYFLFGIILQFLITAFIRCSYRGVRRFVRVMSGYVRRGEKIRTIVVGAGQAGRILTRQVLAELPRKRVICCFVDDNNEKVGRNIEGIKIEGTRYELPQLVEKYDANEILLAIPSISSEDRKEILEICKSLECRIRTLPSLSKMIDGKISLNQIRSVSVEELLGREPILLNNEAVGMCIKNKRVLVTGAGSIGSEIIRQVASYNPEMLAIYDIYENNGYDVQQEIKMQYPDVNLKVYIGSVEDKLRTEFVIREVAPDIIYHTAAHKHVPLMESSPNEAIKTNVGGTYNVADIAGRNGVSKMVLISTDKAVNPTNIMGASKRIAEMIIQYMTQKYTSTIYSAVRFGNVLGSNGSVIPLFKKQILKGGPVTVTHPEITRFFMTIPEAVSLILQTELLADRGEIFILDMGEPVKILDLAKNLIYLSGNTPGKDIRIEITGLRPGEKLYEELLLDEEGIQKTENGKIYIGQPLKIGKDFESTIKELIKLANEEKPNIKEKVKSIVKTYHPEE